jgi:hypothetical protein
MANKPEEALCVSLETAKRLQVVGIVVKPSCFYWAKITGKDFMSDWHLISHNDWIEKSFSTMKEITLEWIPAPTAEGFDYPELPDVVETNGKIYFLRITKAVNHWRINYCNHNSYDKSICLIDYDKLGDLFPENDHKLCEVMATVAIWIKQNVKEGE